MISWSYPKPWQLEQNGRKIRVSQFEISNKGHFDGAKSNMAAVSIVGPKTTNLSVNFVLHFSKKSFLLAYLKQSVKTHHMTKES